MDGWVSFNVYNVNELLYFDMGLYGIDLKFWTLLGARHLIVGHGNAHSIFLLKFLGADLWRTTRRSREVLE